MDDDRPKPEIDDISSSAKHELDKGNEESPAQENEEALPYLSFDEAYKQWADFQERHYYDDTREHEDETPEEEAERLEGSAQWFQEDAQALARRLQASSDLFTQELRHGSLSKVLEYLSDLIGSAPELREFAIRFTERHFGAIDDELKKIDSPLTELTASFLAAKVAEQEDGYREGALYFLDRHIPSCVAHAGKDRYDYIQVADLLAPVFAYGDSFQTARARAALSDLANQEREPGQEDHAPDIISEVFSNNNERVRIHGETLIREQLRNRFQLDDRIFWNKWYHSDRKEEPNSSYGAIAENYRMVCRLESAHPGICKALFDEFGIADFARYPEEMLIKQYQQRNNSDMPFGLVVFPEDDWNGAFYYDHRVFEELMKQLGEEYALRAFEVTSTRELVGVLNRARRKYGKSEFMILGGHGTRETVSFGHWTNYPRSTLEKTQAQRSGANALQHAFVENPTIMLFSCSTGQLGGIGQQISELGTTGATVIAPNKPTAAKELSVTKDESGKLRFKVKYVDEGAEEEYQAGGPQDKPDFIE